MADQHHGRAHGIEFGLQPFDDGQVEMVGRLVEQQDIGLGGQYACQSGTAALAARQGFRIFGAGQAERAQQILRAILVITRPETRFDIIKRGGIGGQVRLLRQIAQSGAGLDKAQAGVMRHVARGDLEQGRFARAIAANQRDALTGRDNEFGALEQGRATEGQFDILKRKKGCCSHGADRTQDGNKGKLVRCHPALRRRPAFAQEDKRLARALRTLTSRGRR